MSKQITISDQTVNGLKRIAEPLEDSYDSVIGRLVDYYERHHDAKPPVVTFELDGAEREFNAFEPPDLTHTKLMSARVAGALLGSANWNGLLDATLRIGFKRLGSFAALRNTAPVNMVEGRKTKEGYHFLADVGLSVQGQDANDAWKYTAHLARRLGCEIEAHFIWRIKEGAAFPGTSGRLVIAGRW